MFSFVDTESVSMSSYDILIIIHNIIWLCHQIPAFLDIQPQVFGSENEDDCILYNLYMSKPDLCIISYSALTYISF